MLLRREPKNVFIALLIGLIFGSVVGKILFLILPDSNAKTVIFHELKIGIPQVSLNLGIFGFSFSFFFSINLFSIIFALFVIYLLIKY